ncbi:gap junction beta-2 protein [Halichoeres trimaculatus]|uniref:gap junction beta-2 protein n=1 Tax=Halichoeres trimaculatus TaxID=147232 RepID=UPI003D9F4D51
MAALVTGLIPILRTAVDATTTYKCRSLWFGFLCVRLVILFLAELPFTKLDADFSCNSTKDICTRACFNRHFNKPVMVAWNFIYVLVVLSVLLMELFTSHLRSMAQKRKEAAGDVETEAQGKDPRGRTVLDLHRDRSSVSFYLLSIFLRILVETWFLFVLLCWNLPALRNDLYECSADICSGFHVCVVRAAPEKRMSIYALASISGMMVVVSVLFCLYSISHYLCRF